MVWRIAWTENKQENKINERKEYAVVLKSIVKANNNIRGSDHVLNEPNIREYTWIALEIV